MSAHNPILTLKTPAATLRKIATGLGLILKGDARKSSVKADWIKQIKEAQALKVPSSLDLILGIVSYRYTNRSVELGAYLIDKFGCSKKISGV